MWVGGLGLEIRGVLEREGGGLGGWERRGGGWVVGARAVEWGVGERGGGGEGVVGGGWGVRWWCGVEWCKWEEVKEDRCGC